MILKTHHSHLSPSYNQLMRTFRRKIFTVRWAASLAGCSLLFGILWLGVGLGCDHPAYADKNGQTQSGCTDRPVVWHIQKWRIK